MDDDVGLVGIERQYRMANIPWTSIIFELRADRGMLLGSEIYADMTGIEQQESLDKLDTSLKCACEWLVYNKEMKDEMIEARSMFKKWGRKKWIAKVIVDLAALSDLELEVEGGVN